MIDTKTTDLLLKLRKGATASFTIGTVIKLADALGGWKFEKKILVINLTEDTRAMRDLIGADRELSLYRDSESEGFRVEGTKDSAKVTIALNKVISAIDASPAKPKAGKLYFSNVSSVKTGKQAWSKEIVDSFTFKAQLAVESYTVTAPNGKTITISKKPSYKAIDLYTLLPWMVEQGFVDQALAALKMEPHGPAVPRTIDNSGTCPVCFGNFKLRADGRTMVNHGYTQEYGHGQHRGDDCYGVKLVNYEMSAQGSKEYLNNVVKGLHASQIKRVAELNAKKAAGVTEILTGFLDRKGNPTKVGIEAAIFNAETDLKTLAAQERFFTYAVENWIAREPLVEGVPVPNYLKDYRG